MKKLLFAVAIFLFTLPAAAQKGNIGFVYPCGAQRGTTIELTVGGQNLSKATGILVGGKGVTGELIPGQAKPKGKRGKKNIGEEDNLQLADQVKFKLTVAPDAPLGMRDVRIVMPNGLTNRLYFEIGDLPDVKEVPSAALSAQSESLPVTFNGQIMRSDVDRFRFPAKKGQDLVIRVKARVFVPYMADAVPGWFQPIARLYGPDGKEVSYNDDYTFHIDPVIIYRVPQSGFYEVELNDALYRGREDFVYRIDVGELPFITSISPLGGKVGKKQTVTLTGYNLKKKTIDIRPAKEGLQEIGNALFFDATREFQLPTKKLQPNTSREASWELEIGECVENVISTPMQQHWYSFAIEEKKIQVHLSVLSRRLGTPADIRFTLFDGLGRTVADVDDFEDEDDYMTTHFADPQLTKLLSMGRYYLRVIESQGHAGPDYAYRLYLSKASPDFSLHLEPATFSVPENGTGVFNVIINRKQNFNGPVQLDINGLPRGYQLSGNQIRQGQKKALVSVTAPLGAEHKTLNPSVTGTAERGDQTIVRTAVPAESMMQAFYYTHLMPIDDFRMEVGPEQPYRVSVDKNWSGALALRVGDAPVELRVKVDRKPGFSSPVTLMLKTNMPGAKADAVVVEAGQSEGVLMVYCPLKTAPKKDRVISLSVSAVTKGSSKKIAGQGRSAFVAAVTAYTPVFDAVILSPSSRR